MEAWKATELIMKYAICPKCGNDKVGDSEGTIEIENEILHRSCKCGWFITVDSAEKILKTSE